MADVDDFDEVDARHIAVMHELLSAFTSGDEDAPSRAMRPDVIVVQPMSTPFGGTFHGIGGVRTMLDQMGRHWSRQWNWVNRFLSDHFIVNYEEVRWHALATGREVTLETVSLYRFRDRRIARIDVFTQDTALLLATLEPSS
jgi:ketosteroid isomerase-like protein